MNHQINVILYEKIRDIETSDANNIIYSIIRYLYNCNYSSYSLRQYHALIINHGNFQTLHWRNQLRTRQVLHTADQFT